jgi:hypothetical protein
LVVGSVRASAGSAVETTTAFMADGRLVGVSCACGAAAKFACATVTIVAAGAGLEVGAGVGSGVDAAGAPFASFNSAAPGVGVV